VVSDSDDRLRAARILIRVEHGAFASRLLDRERRPGVRNRVLGVLRWRRALDDRIRGFVSRPLRRLDPEVRAVLRLGCFEATELGVPAPVATDAMVRLIRTLGKSSAAGMVNAVLRRVCAALGDGDVPVDLRWSHPEWVWRRWSRSFGESAAEEAMAAAQQPAAPWVWFIDDIARDEAERSGVELEAHPWCPGAWTTAGPRTPLMTLVGEGVAVVQDPSSQLVARIAAVVAGGAGSALDLCAAPGGKTLLLDRLGRWDPLVAGDRNPARALRLLRRSSSIAVLAADATRPAVAEGAWDLVLLDAPCSGTGTFRRHPELKWRLTRESIDEAAASQRSMIRAAVGLLGPAGVLVYATCSIEPEENEAHFVSVPAGFEPVALRDRLPQGLPWMETPAGGVRILPHEHGDGFTVHALRRV
jgi:16S rRNA (cytosine967-C5)-methyltransferase